MKNSLETRVERRRRLMQSDAQASGVYVGDGRKLEATRWH